MMHMPPCTLRLAQKKALLEFFVSGVALTEYGLYMSPTITADGAAVNEFARNQNVSIANTLNVFYDPTYSALGTVSIPRFLGAGTNIVSREGGEKVERVVYLPESTSVIIAAKNVAAAAQERLGIYLDWFEVG